MTTRRSSSSHSPAIGTSLTLLGKRAFSHPQPSQMLIPLPYTLSVRSLTSFFLGLCPAYSSRTLGQGPLALLFLPLMALNFLALTK